MNKRLLITTTYLGTIFGTAGLAGLLLIIADRYPEIANNQLTFSIPVTIAWFGLALFILNKAYDDELGAD